MVKGISRQVIVVNSQDKKLFDQAIFILSDEAINGEGITDKMLLQEAKRLMNRREYIGKVSYQHNLFFALAGAVFTGAIWLLTAIL